MLQDYPRKGDQLSKLNSGMWALRKYLTTSLDTWQRQKFKEYESRSLVVLLVCSAGRGKGCVVVLAGLPCIEEWSLGLMETIYHFWLESTYLHMMVQFKDEKRMLLEEVKKGLKPRSINWPRLIIVPIIWGLQRVDGIVHTPFPPMTFRFLLWVAIIEI